LKTKCECTEDGQKVLITDRGKVFCDVCAGVITMELNETDTTDRNLSTSYSKNSSKLSVSSISKNNGGREK